MAKDKTDSVSSVLTKEKTCKSSIRYSTANNATENVTYTIYLLNKACEALGNPEKIEVTVKAAK